VATAFCSAHLHRLQLSDVVDLARAAGYDGLDINGDCFARSPPPHITPGLSPQELEESAQIVRRLATASSALSANIYLVASDPDAALAAKTYVKSAILLARDLGVPFVHVFTGRLPTGMPRAAARRQLADALAELCGVASSCGVRLGIEGCAAHFVRSTREHVELLLDLPGSDLRVCLDPSHIFLHGESVVEAAEVLFDRISLIHVKDASGRYPDFELPPLGHGEMDWPELFGLLSRLGYRGNYAVEYEAAQFGWREDDMSVLVHGREFLRQNGI
jgi:sugar phosphate isomerase/epimerase